MAVEKETYTKYYVRCDQCGDTAPSCETLEVAVATSTLVGFTVSAKWDGQAYVTTTQCRKCRTGRDD
ncbi:MAG TPA: hypothetical protein VMY98_02065 [Anaerolineae bacterium]|nr:hypothetical protein [Anaerolineae bacterium]